MTRIEKIKEMLEYLGVKTDIVVFDESRQVVDQTGHRLNGKIVPGYYYTDTVQSRAEKIDKWLKGQTDGPNNDDYLWRLVFAEVGTCHESGKKLCMDNNTRVFLIITNNWYN